MNSTLKNLELATFLGNLKYAKPANIEDFDDEYGLIPVTMSDIKELPALLATGRFGVCRDMNNHICLYIKRK